MLISTAAMTPETPMQQWLDLCVDEHQASIFPNYPVNFGTIPAYQKLYEDPVFKAQGIIAYIHSDVTIHEKGWDRRIAEQFADPQVAIVGMGGATGIGTSDLYRKPYRIEQLQRIEYYSNQTDWATHGKRETGARDVAVVDGFFIAARRSFLDEIGGWKWFPYTLHCYDTCLCLQALRHGYKVRMVGVNVTHHGGGGSTTPDYRKWCEARGTTMEREHYEPHDWMYKNFVDCLPWRTA
jgi:hypothetical protein